MNDSDKPSRKRLVIAVAMTDNVPSFKNSKKIARIKGKPALITDPKKQEWMEEATRRIESELWRLYQTAVTGTSTECFLQYWIATSLPLDDSLKWIGMASVEWQRVTKGCEGFELHIEQL